jgi:hypothetical protein
MRSRRELIGLTGGAAATRGATEAKWATGERHMPARRKRPRSRFTSATRWQQCSKMPMITNGSPKEPKNEQQGAGHNQSNFASAPSPRHVRALYGSMPRGDVAGSNKCNKSCNPPYQLGLGQQRCVTPVALLSQKQARRAQPCKGDDLGLFMTD